MTTNDTRNISLEEMDKQSMLHPFTPLADHLKNGPKVMAHGKGVELTDIHGNRYIDAMAGLWCVNIGYGRTEIADAIHKQATELAYYHAFGSMATEAPIRLADRLLALAPGDMSKVFFGSTGSDANDTQIKLVWYYNNLRGRPEKKKFISRDRAYHGATVAAASLSGLPLLHNAFDLPLPQMRHVSAPHHYWNAEPGESERDYSKRLARELDETIEREGPETVAAFIAEPLMGGGGVIVPPEGYFQEIQPVLKKHEVLMIADEVICGFGRLGTWFGSETFGIEPDMVTIAKGLTSGYIPLSGSLISEEIWQVLLESTEKLGPFGHGYTYSAHPIGAAAAMANLDIIEKEDLVGNAKKVGAHMQAQLRARFGDHPLVGEVRGVGLVAAVELVKDRQRKEKFDPTLKVAGRTAANCLKLGLISRALPNSDALAFSPPLVVTEAEVDEIIDRADRALNETMDSLVREEIWSGAA